VESDRGQAEHAIDGASVDVDELQSPIGHDGGPVEHDAAEDEQISGEFGVTDGPGLPEDDDGGHDPVDEHGRPDCVQPWRFGGEDDREDDGDDEQRDRDDHGGQDFLESVLRADAVEGHIGTDGEGQFSVHAVSAPGGSWGGISQNPSTMRPTIISAAAAIMAMSMPAARSLRIPGAD